MLNTVLTALQEHLESNTLIYLSPAGSHLYGLNTENSDLDFKGIYIPSKEDVILKRDKDEINVEINIEDKKVEVKLFSIYKFIKLCSKADTNALDLLFSYSSKFEKYIPEIYIENETKYKLIEYIYEYANLLIDTSRLENPITYAYKQAEKYSKKGVYVKILDSLIELVQDKIDSGCTSVQDIIPFIQIDGKNLRIDELDNKGKIEKYLFVCGVQHQFNLSLNTFSDRLWDKLDNYSSRSLQACRDEGNDWKALSHALRILSQVKELYETGDIIFPLKNKEFILKVKLGQVSREEVNKIFDTDMSNVLKVVKEDKLHWIYNEEFWNNFLLDVIK